MRLTDRFSLTPSDVAGRAVLGRRDGRGDAVTVDGTVLEAQHALPDGGTLVWLTDDSPYEEGLHVYLLDADGAVEDAVEAGAMWAAGILELGAHGAEWIELAFFNNDRRYRLTVEPTAGVRLRLPAGWRYKARLQRHRLAVHELDGDDTR